MAKDRTNPRLDYRIVLTMSDMRARHSKEVEAATRAGQGDHVLKTVVRRSVTFADAAAARESVLSFAPRSAAASFYRELANEIELLKK